MIVGKEKDLVIVLVTYNHENYISDAIESVLEQETKYSYQIFIIDDASTDNNQKIIKNYQEKHTDKIVSLLFEKNNGPGLFQVEAKIESKYIAYLDGDDYWCSKHKIEKQIDFLEANPEYSGVGHPYKIVYEHIPDKDDLVVKPAKNEWCIDDMLEHVSEIYCHTATYIRKNIFKTVSIPKYTKKQIYCGDALISFVFAEYGPVKALDDVMSVHRHTGKGIWTSMSAKDEAFSIIKLFETLNEYFNYKYSKELRAQQKRIIKHFCRVHSKDKKFKLLCYLYRLKNDIKDLFRSMLLLSKPC